MLRLEAMTTADDNERSWISGLFSVQAAIEGGVRPVYRVLVPSDRLDGATARVQQAARDRAIPLERVSALTLQELVGGEGRDIVADVGPRRFLKVEELLAGPAPPAVFMLDGIEDPFNLGQAIRSLYAAGATGLVLPPRNWLTATETVLRASAGTADRLPIALAGDSAAEVMRRHAVSIIVATERDGESLYATDLRRPFFVVIGGEKRGISRTMLHQADRRLMIPYGRPFDGALGAAAAAAVIGFEALRQRQ